MLSAACGALAGCSAPSPERVEASAAEAEPSATIAAAEPLARLELRWTIAGVAEPARCVTASAAVIDLSVVSPETGGELEAFQELCSRFATTLTVIPARYTVRVRLLDTTGRPRTPAIDVGPFVLTGDVLRREEVDFGALL